MVIIFRLEAKMYPITGIELYHPRPLSEHGIEPPSVGTNACVF